MANVERGLIISFLGQKGGCGKSTICENVAAALAADPYNADVLLMDCDPNQKTSTNWIQRRNEAILNGAKINPIHSCIIQPANIKEAALDAAKRYGVVIIDPEGRDGKALRLALLVSDIVYLPVQPTQNDLETLEYLHELILDTKPITPNRIVRTLLTRTPTHPTRSDSLMAGKFIIEFGEEMPSSEVFITDRVAYKRAAVEGKGVIEPMDAKPDIKAINEINKLVKEILQNA